MSAWSRCGQPELLADALLPLDVARDRAATPRGRGAGASPPARRPRTGARRSARACRPGSSRRPGRSGSPSSPATRWSTRTPTRRSGPGRKSRRCSARSSTPSRYSTTTPSTRRSSPHTFSTSSASWRPSTKIRLARATRAFVPGTATDPDAVRVGAAGPERAGGTRMTGTPSSRKPVPIGNVRRLPRRSSSVTVPRSRSTATISPHQSVVTSSTTRPLSAEISTARPRRGARQSVFRTSEP